MINFIYKKAFRKKVIVNLLQNEVIKWLLMKIKVLH